jgi:hypothetical protein
MIVAKMKIRKNAAICHCKSSRSALRRVALFEGMLFFVVLVTLWVDAIA